MFSGNLIKVTQRLGTYALMHKLWFSISINGFLKHAAHLAFISFRPWNWKEIIQLEFVKMDISGSHPHIKPDKRLPARKIN